MHGNSIALNNCIHTVSGEGFIRERLRSAIPLDFEEGAALFAAEIVRSEMYAQYRASGKEAASALPFEHMQTAIADPHAASHQAALEAQQQQQKQNHMGSTGQIDRELLDDPNQSARTGAVKQDDHADSDLGLDALEAKARAEEEAEAERVRREHEKEVQQRVSQTNANGF